MIRTTQPVGSGLLLDPKWGFNAAILPSVGQYLLGRNVSRTVVVGTPTTGVSNAGGFQRQYALGQAEFYNHNGLNFSTGYSWLWVGNWSQLGNFGGLICAIRDNTQAFGAWAWGKAAASTTLYVIHNESSGVNTGILITDILSTQSAVWIGSWDGATVSLWRNGVLLGSADHAVAPPFFAGTGRLGPAATRDTQTTIANFTLAAVSTAKISAEALTKLSVNPWQLFMPLRDRPHDLSGGVAPTFKPWYAPQRSRGIGIGMR